MSRLKDVPASQGDLFAAFNEQVAQKAETPQEASDDAMFLSRNHHLESAAVSLGDAAQADGASKRIAGGSAMLPFRSSEHASEVAERNRNQARYEISLACGQCALKSVCELSNGKLLPRLRDPKARSRFVNRMRNEPSNGRLCETNLTPGRLPKDAI